MIFQRWPSTHYLKQGKKHFKSINPKKYLVTYVTYLSWKIKEFIFSLHWAPDQSNFEKNIFLLIIFTPLAFTVTEISVVLTFNLDFWEIEKQ